jgi:glycosyltransferase involved in cell wall biosynthesis
MHEIQISVIITTHNRATLLMNAINSVLNQTFKDFEMLIVDDASKDNTEEVVKTFTDGRIRYIKIFPEDSKGGNHARNVGIKEAKGEFIAFLDDDDEWLPEKLEKQFEVFGKDEKIGLVYTGFKFIYENEWQKIHLAHPKRGNLSKDIMIRNYFGPLSVLMVKKKILEEAGLFDIEMPARQDYDIYVRLCQICEVDFVREPLLKYHHRTNIKRITGNLKKYEKANSLINEKYKNLILALDIKSRNKRESIISEALAIHAMSEGDFNKVKKYYMKSLVMKFRFKIFIKLCFAFMGIYKIHEFFRLKRGEKYVK